MYYIKEVSTLTGLSPRAIRYYDDIGLVKPIKIEENGYRIYDADSISKLKDIIFFKELDFSLKEIKIILTSKKYSQLEILKEQKKLLILKRNRYDTLISSIEDTICSVKEGKKLDKNILTGKDTYEKYKVEVLTKYGESNEYKEFSKKKYTKNDYNKFDKETKEFFDKLASYMHLGYESTEVSNLVEEWQKYITANFYTCTDEVLLSLAHLYLEDTRFTKNFEKIKPGLASFFSNGIKYYLNMKK